MDVPAGSIHVPLPAVWSEVGCDADGDRRNRVLGVLLRQRWGKVERQLLRRLPRSLEHRCRDDVHYPVAGVDERRDNADAGGIDLGSPLFHASDASREDRTSNIIVTVIWIAVTCFMVAVFPTIPMWANIIFWISSAWFLFTGFVRTYQGPAVSAK